MITTYDQMYEIDFEKLHEKLSIFTLWQGMQKLADIVRKENEHQSNGYGKSDTLVNKKE